jgi:hypothetical protein
MIFDAMTNFEVATAAHRARVRAATRRPDPEAGSRPDRRARRNGARTRPRHP